VSKVLVVDDDRDFRGVVKFALVAAGYEVTESGDPRDALEKVHEDHPDLILLGLTIAGSDAAEALKELNENPETSEIPVIILVSEGQDGLDASQLEAQDVITKPFTAGQLASKVQIAIDKSKANNGKGQPNEAGASSSQPQLREFQAEKSQPAASSIPEPRLESVEDSGEVLQSKARPANAQNANEPYYRRFLPSATITAIAMALILGATLVLGLMAYPIQNTVQDVDFAEIFSLLPMIDDKRDDKDYHRWDPWIECVADSMEAARQEAIGLSGTEAGGIAVTEPRKVGEPLGEVEQQGGRDTDAPTYIPDC